MADQLKGQPLHAYRSRELFRLFSSENDTQEAQDILSASDPGLWRLRALSESTPLEPWEKDNGGWEEWWVKEPGNFIGWVKRRATAWITDKFPPELVYVAECMEKEADDRRRESAKADGLDEGGQIDSFKADEEDLSQDSQGDLDDDKVSVDIATSDSEARAGPAMVEAFGLTRYGMPRSPSPDNLQPAIPSTQEDSPYRGNNHSSQRHISQSDRTYKPGHESTPLYQMLSADWWKWFLPIQQERHRKIKERAEKRKQQGA